MCKKASQLGAVLGNPPERCGAEARKAWIPLERLLQLIYNIYYIIYNII